METTSLILHDYANMQDIKDDEETDPVATQLSSPIEQLRLFPLKRELQRIRDELFDVSLYSGVELIYRLREREESRLTERNFKFNHCDSPGFSNIT